MAFGLMMTLLSTIPHPVKKVCPELHELRGIYIDVLEVKVHTYVFIDLATIRAWGRGEDTRSNNISERQTATVLVILF